MKTLFRITSIFFALFLLVSLNHPAQAVFFQSGDKVNLSKEKKIDESAMVGGGDLTFDADIAGDLYCAGRNVVINGHITGDVLCAAQHLQINGPVDGNVRAVAQDIEINSLIGRNVSVVSQNLSLSQNSSIKGDIFFGGQQVKLSGLLGRDLLGGASDINISGSLFRNAIVTASHLTVDTSAKIGGNLEYYMEKTATPSLGQNTIKGQVIKHEVNTEEPVSKPPKNHSSWSFASLFFGTLSCLALGLLLLYFSRGSLLKRAQIIVDKPLAAGLVGLSTLIVTPIVFILLLLTVIGIPVALVLILVYLLSLLVASLYLAFVLGRLALVRLFKLASPRPIQSLAIGIIIFNLLLQIPFIGFFVGLFALCLGLGAITLSLIPKE